MRESTRERLGKPSLTSVEKWAYSHKVSSPIYTEDEYPHYLSKRYTRCICGKARDHHHTAHTPPWTGRS